MRNCGRCLTEMCELRERKLSLQGSFTREPRLDFFLSGNNIRSDMQKVGGSYKFVSCSKVKHCTGDFETARKYLWDGCV